jgi:hypothetical protein
MVAMLTPILALAYPLQRAGQVCRLCVRNLLRLSVFPLASLLSSTASLASAPASFGGFAGTMRLCDFPRPCIIGVRPWTFRCGL